ncbi:transposase [Enterobacter soli]
MIKKKAFKFLLEPNESQISEILVFAGACRFVYNKGLALLSENYNIGKPFLNYNKTAPLLVEWKNDNKMEWLKLCPSQCLQQSLRDLDRAFQHFFAGRSQYPRFKKKGRSDSFRVPSQRVRLKQDKSLVSLPKLGWVKYRKSREVTGDLKNVTVSKKFDKWYISFNTEEVVPEPVHPSVNKTKILLNDGYVTLCSGNEVSVEKFTSLVDEKKLKRLSKMLSRKVKHSNNWLKNKKKIDRIRSRSGNFRLDALHKITTTICKKHAVVEVISVTNSVPDKNNVATNMRYEFVRQLLYKQEWLGGKIIQLDA